MRVLQHFSVLAGAALLLVGCAPAADLRPAERANTAPELEQAAVTTKEGIRVLTQADEWPGRFPVKREITPVRVRIENSGDAPLALRYEDLTLVGSNGEVYRALPPFRIDGEVANARAVPTYGPIAEPGFAFDGFGIAPVYAPAYPTLTPVADPFLYDPVFYENAYTYWNETELPTAAMLVRALPEGVIERGGFVEGWVYFEKVPDTVERVTFSADLVNANTRNQFAEVRMSYNVD